VVAVAQGQACSRAPAPFRVTSATEAAALAKAAACANATISAIWQSKVQLLKRIRVGRGTSVVITGENVDSAIIDGGGRMQLLDVRGVLTLINMTLSNGFSDEENGGAVSIGSFGSLSVIGSVFSNNVVIGKATAVATSTSNFVDDGDAEDALTITGRGGAVYGDVNSKISISNSTFINNTAAIRGGGIWSEGTVSIMNSLFTSNAACVGHVARCAGGGAVACNGDNLTISDSIFTNNSAVDHYGYDLDLDDQSGGNVALAAGGALSFSFRERDRLSSQVTIRRCTFRDNTADEGGAVDLNRAKLNLTACTFVSNTATYTAGAILIDFAVLRIKQCEFINITAISGDAGALHFNVALAPGEAGTMIESSIFDGNSCTISGGAILVGESSDLVVFETTFTGNTAYEGGAVAFIGGNDAFSEVTLAVKGSNFTANQATVGGAIASTADTAVSLSGLLLADNKATSGGALYILGSVASKNNMFTNNSAQSQGGAIVGGPASNLTLVNTTCSNNKCSTNGGCIYTTSTLVCKNCTVTGNEAVLNGGALYTDFGTFLEVTFSNSRITGNIAQQSGGAWFGFGVDSLETTASVTAQMFNNTAGCCYASGYGSTLQSNASTSATCSDTDTGTDCTVTVRSTLCTQS
jgi:predicted outer membrane repeat protein